MSLLAVLYKLVPESPILIAFNREELVTQKVNKPRALPGAQSQRAALVRGGLLRSGDAAEVRRRAGARPERNRSERARPERERAPLMSSGRGVSREHRPRRAGSAAGLAETSRALC